MDIERPELNGLAANPRIKSRKKLESIPVVVVSAYVAQQFRPDAFAGGCSEYVSTPFEPENLEKVTVLFFAETKQMSSQLAPTKRTRRPLCVNIFALVFLLVPVGGVVGQDSLCNARLSDLPQAAELSGFRMGMTKDEVKARVPQVVFGRTDDLGASKTSINPFFDSRIDKSGFADVRTVSLDFLDGRVTSLWIGFEPTFKWPGVSEFVKGISRSLSLPDAWSPWKSEGQQLKCADFRITVATVARGPSFRILDLAAEASLTARRFAKEEEKEALAADNSEKETEVLGDKQSRIYYPANCEAVKEISESNRTTFKTALEAEKAGYKPAQGCER